MKQDREYVWISSTRLLPSWLQLSFRSSWELWQRLSPTLHQCAERGCTTSSCGSRTTTGEHFWLPFSGTMSFFYFLLAIYNIFPNQSGLNPDTITMYHYFYSFYVSNRASTVGQNQSHIDSLKSWFRMLFISYIFRIAIHGLAAALTAACTVLILLWSDFTASLLFLSVTKRARKTTSHWKFWMQLKKHYFRDCQMKIKAFSKHQRSAAAWHLSSLSRAWQS